MKPVPFFLSFPPVVWVLLCFILPFFVLLVGSCIILQDPGENDIIAGASLSIPIAISLQVAAIWCWQFLMGHFLNRSLDTDIRLSKRLFNVLTAVEFVIPSVCFVTASIWYSNIPAETIWLQSHMGWLVGAFASYGLVFLYRSSFIARSLKAVELGRRPKMKEWIRYFLFLCVSPVGMLLLHAKVQRLAKAVGKPS